MSAIKYSTAPETRARVQSTIAGLDNPDHKSMLQVWLKHWWGEVLYDLDTVLDTVTDDIAYRWYGTEQIGDGLHENSRAFAGQMYQAMFDAKLTPGGPFDQERWSFNGQGLTLEAVFTAVLTGGMLKGKSAQPDPDRLYLVQWPMMVAHPFTRDPCLMAGEIMYPGPPAHIEPADLKTVSRLLGREV